MLGFTNSCVLVQKVHTDESLENSYSNFVNSINSEQTRQVYEYSNTFYKTLPNGPGFFS